MKWNSLVKLNCTVIRILIQAAFSSFPTTTIKDLLGWVHSMNEAGRLMMKFSLLTWNDTNIDQWNCNFFIPVYLSELNSKKELEFNL